jgi:hypothetical protein
MDVKIEGENAVRHLDLMTHNHASVPGGTGPWPYLDSVAVSSDNKCSEDIIKEQNACKDYEPYGSKDACKELKSNKKPSGKKSSTQAPNLAARSEANECLAARRCMLQPYKPNRCCAPQTGHHLIEASALFDKGRGGSDSVPLAGVNTGTEDYNEDKAPCVCAEGVNQNTGSHGRMHTLQSTEAAKAKEADLKLSNGKTIRQKATTYKKAKQNGIQAMKTTFPNSNCEDGCIEKQLDNYHSQCGINDKTKIKAVETGTKEPQGPSVVPRKRKRRASGR